MTNKNCVKTPRQEDTDHALTSTLPCPYSTSGALLAWLDCPQTKPLENVRPRPQPPSSRQRTVDARTSEAVTPSAHGQATRTHGLRAHTACMHGLCIRTVYMHGLGASAARASTSYLELTVRLPSRLTPAGMPLNALALARALPTNAKTPQSGPCYSTPRPH